MNEPVFGNIPIDAIRASKTNPRKRFDEAGIADLAKSIKEQGLGQPLLVRPHPDGGDLVEIVAGERRYRACKLAGLAQIPAIVRVMSDVDALQFQLVENLQREDVHPIEEAEGYDRLMKEHGFTADQCAEKVGKSKAYIYGRLKFGALIPDAKTAFYDGKLSASTALLIARIPVATLQAKATKEVTNGFNNGELFSFRQAAKHIQQRYMLDLDEARFPIGDAKLLPIAGACSACPKRTGNAPDLFQDVSGADVCTDPDCFAAKGKALDARTMAYAKKKGIPVEKKSLWEIERENPTLIGLHRSLWQFDRRTNDAQEPVEKLLPAELIPDPVKYAKDDDDGDGEVIPLYEKTAIQAALEKAGLCLTIEQHTAAMKDKLRDQPTPTKGSAKQMDKEKDAIAVIHKNTRQAELHSTWRVAVYQAIRDQISKTDNHIIALKLIARIMADDWSFPRELTSLYDFNPNTTADVAKYIHKADAQQLMLFMLDICIGAELHVSQYDIQNIKDTDPEDLLALARQCDVDAKKLREEMIPVKAEEVPEEKPAAKKTKVKAEKKVQQKTAKVQPETADPKPAAKKKVAQPKAKKAMTEAEALAAWPFPTRTAVESETAA